MANNYLKLGNFEKMFSCLERAAEHAISFDTLGDGKFTSFMVNKIDFSSINAVKDHSENQSGLLLKALEKEMYKHLKNDPRMIRIFEKLSSVAIV